MKLVDPNGNILYKKQTNLFLTYFNDISNDTIGKNIVLLFLHFVYINYHNLFY
jgi:hypothetical protein